MKPLIPLLVLLTPVAADPLRTASVSATVNDVQIFPGNSAPSPAAVGAKFSAPSSIQTGRQSRTELTFNDNTITRLGQNSVFNFRQSGRDVELKQGSVLLQVPKNAGGAKIRTATVTAAITGTTVMFEYSPDQWVKLLTLEGTQTISINGSNQTVSVPAGKMIIMHPNATVIPEPITIDIKELMKTSLLAGDKVFPPLPPLARKLIEQTIEKQLVDKREGLLLPTVKVISGAGSHNTSLITETVQNVTLAVERNPDSPNPNPSPGPGPSPIPTPIPDPFPNPIPNPIPSP
jgi:FecR protein